MVEQHVGHVVGDHWAEVKRVAAVPLPVARRRWDLVLVARLLVPCHVIYLHVHLLIIHTYNRGR